MRLAIIVASVWMVTAPLGSQAPESFDKVRVGSPAPDFQAVDTKGNTVALSDFRRKVVVLVFYRGAASPYCEAQLAELRNLVPPAHSRDTVVVGVSPEIPEKVQEFASALKERSQASGDLILLSDSRRKAIDAYGLLDLREARMGRYLPRPATFLIDPAGSVRWKFSDVNFRMRPTNAMILTELGKIWQ